MIFTIKVTAGDIAANGCEGQDCPVWRAALRALPFFPHLVVGGWNLFPLGRHSRERRPAIPLPWVAKEFIDRNDSRLRTEPFQFELDIPDELIPAGAVP
jgi:hypothetical protein